MPGLEPSLGREWRFLPLAAVLLFAIVPYLPTLGNGFAFDDAELIAGDSRPIARRVVEDFFGNDASGAPASGYYRPVTSVTYALEKQLYADHARGYHAHNLALHAGNSALLYSLLARVAALSPYALPVALIFAAHPVHAESIAPITGRTDPLGFLFVLLAAHALLRGRRALAALAFALALGSKESSVALAPLLALVPLARGGTRRECAVVGLAGVALGAAFLAFKIRVLGIVPPEDAYTGQGDIGQRALTFVAALAQYLGLLIWPGELTIVRPFPLVGSMLDARLLSGIGLLVVLAAFVASKSKPLAIAAVLFLLPLLPASNLVPITYSYRWLPFPFFERYLYVATAGFALAIVVLGEQFARTRLGEDSARKWTLAGAMLLSIALGARLWVRTLDFRDDSTLFAAAVASDPNRLEPRIQAAAARFLGGDAAGALAEFDRLLAETPTELPPDASLILERATVQAALAQGLRDHARIAREQGRTEFVEPLEKRALELEQDATEKLEALRARKPVAVMGRVHALLGILAGLRGDAFAAARMFREAANARGAPPDLRGNFLVVIERLRAVAKGYANQGRAGAASAISTYRRALEAITGSYPPSAVPDVVREETLTLWCELADQYVLIGQSEQASADYVRLLAIEPKLARCHEGLGFLCKQGGNRAAAYDHFEKALAIEPESWFAINEMFTMLREEGRHEEAAEYSKRFQAYIAKHGTPGRPFENPPIDAEPEERDDK